MSSWIFKLVWRDCERSFFYIADTLELFLNIDRLEKFVRRSELVRVVPMGQRGLLLSVCWVNDSSDMVFVKKVDIAVLG